jgi:hypothetical protein
VSVSDDKVNSIRDNIRDLRPFHEVLRVYRWRKGEGMLMGSPRKRGAAVEVQLQSFLRILGNQEKGEAEMEIPWSS